MKLSAMLKQFDRVRLATEEDNSSILDFYEAQSMQSGGLTLRYSRQGDFFSFLKHQGRSHFTFLFLNSDGSIQGVASYVISDQLVQGARASCAYLCDVRMACTAEPETRQQWKQFYVAAVKNSHLIEEFEFSEYMFSAILDANKKALNAFMKLDSPIEFLPLKKYASVQVLGRLGPSFTRSNIKIRPVDEYELQKLFDFLKAKDQYFDLTIGVDEFHRRLKTWENFNISDFLVCEGPKGDWLACSAPWSSSHSRSIVVEEADWKLRWTSKSLALFGGKPLSTGDEIKTTYLTHLSFAPEISAYERSKAVKALVDHLFKIKTLKQSHTISFIWPQEQIKILKQCLRNYILQTTSGTFYQTRPKNRPEAQVFDQSVDEKINFELALA